MILPDSRTEKQLKYGVHGDRSVFELFYRISNGLSFVLGDPVLQNVDYVRKNRAITSHLLVGCIFNCLALCIAIVIIMCKHEPI